MNTVRAWHFVGDTLRDGSPVPKDGVKLVHTGKVIPCESGLHASRDPFDALQYAPGTVLCLVECGGIVVPHGNPEDKIACSERTIVARMDATEMLRYFARQQALSVVHLWEPPQVVLDYLMGDDSASAAASAAARASASAAARAAAWAANSAASRAAAARAAAASAAARASASAAASAAAATSDAWAAAWAAAWDSARAASRADFNALVHECFADYLEVA